MTDFFALRGKKRHNRGRSGSRRMPLPLQLQLVGQVLIAPAVQVCDALAHQQVGVGLVEESEGILVREAATVGKEADNARVLHP